MYCPKCKREYDGKFCPECGAKLIEKPVPQGGFNLNLGDANAISGGVHLADSHNVHNEDKSVHNISNVTNVTQVAAQKTEIEILQEKKTLYLNECKRAYEDNVLEQSEVVALEECRIKLGLNKSTANTILESVRVMSERNARKTELNPIARTKLKILTDNLQKNEVKALMQQIDTLESLVNKYEHDELRRKFYLVLAALKSEKCIALYENTKTDNYWNTFWSYLAYIKSGRISEAEDTLASLDRFTSYPEDNTTVLATAGAIMMGDDVTAKELLNAVIGEYTPALQRFVDSIYLLLEPETAKEMGADENTCAFYLVNFFGQKDPRVKAEEERKRKEAEEAERRKQIEEEKKRKAEEEKKRRAEEKAKREAEEQARREAEEKKKAAEEARLKAEAERKKREEEERKRKAEEERRRLAEAKAKAEREAREKAEAEKKRKEEEERRHAEEERRKQEEARKKAAIKTFNGHECVDLGLPSGTLWATCNIGASKPEEYGNYFAWGETSGYNEGKRDFDNEHYKFITGDKKGLLEFLLGSKWIYTKYCDNKTKGNVDNKSSLDKEDDAGHVQWGKGWRIPTKENFNELINEEYTECSSFTMNGIKGLLITSKINGNSIFIPIGGTYGEFEANEKSDKGEVWYWSRTLGRQNHLAYSLCYIPRSSVSSPLLIDVRRELGMQIRPVHSKE